MRWKKTREERSDLGRLIAQAGTRYALSMDIISSIIWQESRGDSYAIRYEPAFFDRYIVGRNRASLGGYVPTGVPTLATEQKARAMSWGLMQVMGQTARENDFSEPFLSSLLSPFHNIEMGCRILRRKIDRVGGDLETGLLRYNGGGDKKYPDKIFSHISSGDYKQIYSGWV